MRPFRLLRGALAPLGFAIVPKRCITIYSKKNHTRDIEYVREILLKHETSKIDLVGTGLQHVLLPSQYAVLARMGFMQSESSLEVLSKTSDSKEGTSQPFGMALPEELAKLAFDHPSFHTNNAFFETLLFYGIHGVQHHVREHLLFKYPLLPVKDVEHSMSLFLSLENINKTAQKYGIFSAISFHGNENVELEEYSRQSFLALLGASVLHNGLNSIKKLVDDNFCNALLLERSRMVSTTKMTKILLNSLCVRLGKKVPSYRLEGETGRASNDPVFVVGVYCDTEKIGESFGPSLKVAENRACQDALLRYFCLEEETALLRNLPGSTAAKDLRPFPIYDSPAPARNSPRLFKK